MTYSELAGRKWYYCIFIQIIIFLLFYMFYVTYSVIQGYYRNAVNYSYRCMYVLQCFLMNDLFINQKISLCNIRGHVSKTYGYVRLQLSPTAGTFCPIFIVRDRLDVNWNVWMWTDVIGDNLKRNRMFISSYRIFLPLWSLLSNFRSSQCA